MGTVSNDSWNTYKIPHIGLKKAVHLFEFELNEAFFSNFEHALIRQCDIRVTVNFDKRQEPYILDFNFSGTVNTECDRCTAIFPLKINGDFTLYVKFTGDPMIQNEDESEVLLIGHEEQEINLANYLYEFAHLSVPYQKICDDPGKTEYCDKEVVRLLEKLNPEEEEPNADPRWEELNKLKDNLN